LSGRDNSAIQSSIQDPAQLARTLVTVSEHGILVAPPLKTVTDSFYTTWNEKNVIIKPFIEGECSEHFPIELLEEAGALLARIHLVPAPADVVKGRQLFHYSYLDDVADAATAEELDWWKTNLNNTDYVEKSPIPRGLVHGDFWADNIIVTPDRELAVIDWENSSIGSFVYDIAWCLPSLVKSENGYSIDVDRARLFLRGYESVRPLTPEERALLGDALLRASAVISLGRFRKHYVLAPDPSRHDPAKYGKYKEMISIGREARSLRLETLQWSLRPETLAWSLSLRSRT
jgi:homoserine kinase type II